VITAAGVDHPGRLADIPAGDWERVITVDLLATAAVVRAALPYLRDSHGRVVTIASTLGLRAVSDATAYCAAKFGVVGFTARSPPNWPAPSRSPCSSPAACVPASSTTAPSSTGPSRTLRSTTPPRRGRGHVRPAPTTGLRGTRDGRRSEVESSYP
jgi:NAD(P)-dependent dehydrogenase (short-subunit alcohol dehydrogenase family)